MLNVKLVPLLEIIVKLVKNLEKTHHIVIVSLTIISIKLNKFVNNVQITVLNVLAQPSVSLVEETESTCQIVNVQLENGITVKKTVLLVDTDVPPVLTVLMIVTLVLISDLHQTYAHVQVDIMKMLKI
jgi:hypothetical protein